jgi:hypothetical protein
VSVAAANGARASTISTDTVVITTIAMMASEVTAPSPRRRGSQPLDGVEQFRCRPDGGLDEDVAGVLEQPPHALPYQVVVVGRDDPQRLRHRPRSCGHRLGLGTRTEQQLLGVVLTPFLVAWYLLGIPWGIGT